MACLGSGFGGAKKAIEKQRAENGIITNPLDAMLPCGAVDFESCSFLFLFSQETCVLSCSIASSI